MRRIASLVTAVGILATTTSAAAAADLTSVNQSTSQVTTISESNRPIHLAQLNARYRSTIGVDSPYTTRLDNGTRAEFWKLQAAANQCLDLTMRSDDLDSLVGLYWIKGSTGDAIKIAEDDDSGGGRAGLDARLRHVVPTGGAYYVVATSSGGFESGRYSLEISSCATSTVGSSTTWPAQPGNTPFQPTTSTGTSPWQPITDANSRQYTPGTAAPGPASMPSSSPSSRPGTSVPLPRF